MNNEKFYFIKSYKDEALYANSDASETIVIEIDYKGGLVPCEYEYDLLEDKIGGSTFFDIIDRNEVLKTLDNYQIVKTDKKLTLQDIRAEFNTMVGGYIPQKWIEEKQADREISILAEAVKLRGYDPLRSTVFIGCDSVESCSDCKLKEDCDSDFNITISQGHQLSEMVASLHNDDNI
jgi:hypothetical protein